MDPDLSDVAVRTAEGEAVTVGTLVGGQPTVLVAVRYYG